MRDIDFTVVIGRGHHRDCLRWAEPGRSGYSQTMMERITMEPGKRSRQPCRCGMRITVWHVLSWLASGMSEREILDDYPELESDDFRAVYEFAVRMGRRVAL